MCKIKTVSYPIICLLIVICLIGQPVFSAKKTVIAVYHFTSEGASEDLADIVKDVVEETISQTNLFKMPGKKDMQRALDNLVEKQKIKPDCKTDLCLAEIAAALGIELMITGHINMEGTNFVINLRLVNGKKGNTLNTVSEICLCTREALKEKTEKTVLKLLKVFLTFRK